jgi:Cdc6-like AAA superfamily ATPase
MHNFIRTKKNDNMVVTHREESILNAYDKLPAGIYTTSNVGGPFQRIIAYTEVENKDSLINFKEGAFQEIISKFNIFFSDDYKKKYEEIGILRKLGVILYGPPGTGKTCTTTLVMQNLVQNRDAICLNFQSGTSLQWISGIVQEIREIQDNPIVVFIDEVEDFFENNGSAVLPFLDGDESVKDLIFLGCTNYLEQIEDRVKNRKSRIKHLIEIKSLPFDVYKEYINGKIKNIDQKTLSEFAYKCIEHGLVIDQVKNALIDWHIEGVTLDEAILEAKKLAPEEVSED